MGAASTVQVFNYLYDSTNTALANETVHLVLDYNQATVTATGDEVLPSQQTTTTDTTGKYTFTVIPTDLLSPSNITYTVQEPQRSFQIAPLSTNGASQRTTAANVIVNQPGALAAATSNITGPLTVQGLLTAQAGEALTGPLTLSGANAYEDLTEIATPASPAASITRLYSKSDGLLYRLAGTNLEVPVGGAVLDVRDFGGSTAIADNSTAFNNAIAALPSTGGIITYDGSYNFTAAIAAATKTNVLLVGLGGLSGGGSTRSMLVMTNAGARLVDFRSSAGCQVLNTFVYASNASFAGSVVDFSHSTASDEGYGQVAGCNVFVNGHTANSIGINLDKAINTNVDACNFSGAQVQISGAQPASYSNAIRITRVIHNLSSGVCAIKGIAQAWKIDGVTLEASSNVLSGSIIDGTAGANGATIDNVWAGDLGAGSTCIWINIAGNGVAVGRGGYLPTVAGSTAIAVGNSSNGVTIIAPDISGAGTGIAWGTGVTNVLYLGSANAATTPQTGTPVSGLVQSTKGVLNYTAFKARANLAGVQSLASGSTPSIINLDTKDYDTNTNFNTSTHQYTCPVAGLYIVTGGVQLPAGTAAGFAQASIGKNGANAVASGVRVVPSASISSNVGVSDIVSCAAGDTLELDAAQTSGSPMTVATGTNITYFAVHYLSSG